MQHGRRRGGRTLGFRVQRCSSCGRVGCRLLFISHAYMIQNRLPESASGNLMAVWAKERLERVGAVHDDRLAKCMWTTQVGTLPRSMRLVRILDGLLEAASAENWTGSTQGGGQRAKRKSKTKTRQATGQSAMRRIFGHARVVQAPASRCTMLCSSRRRRGSNLHASSNALFGHSGSMSCSLAMANDKVASRDARFQSAEHSGSRDFFRRFFVLCAWVLPLPSPGWLLFRLGQSRQQWKSEVGHSGRGLGRFSLSGVQSTFRLAPKRIDFGSSCCTKCDTKLWAEIWRLRASDRSGGAAPCACVAPSLACSAVCRRLGPHLPNSRLNPRIRLWRDQ